MSAPENPAPQSRMHDLGDLAWVGLVAGTGVGYFLLKVTFGTSFFIANGASATFTPLQVWGTCALILGQAACALWRRSFPVSVLIGIVALLLAATLLTGDRTTVVGMPLLFAVYNLTARTRLTTWLPVLSVVAAVDLVTQLSVYAHLGGPLNVYVIMAKIINTVISYAIAVPAGLLVGSHQRRAELAGEYAEALEREQTALLAAAVVAERNRMARELHDVATHHLSGILLQARAAREVLGSNPPVSAKLLGTVETEGERAIQSLREVVEVLRADAPDDAVAPAARLAQLPELIENVQATNPLIQFRVDGTLDDLSPATSLACFRIIQESLSNARKHAPGANVFVSVRRDAGMLEVEVRNSAPGRPADRLASTGGGFGVTGMRERAVLLGGQLEAGATEDGGWMTRAAIPVAWKTAA